MYYIQPVIPFGFTLRVKTACEKRLKVPYPFEDALPYEEVATMIYNFVQENIKTNFLFSKQRSRFGLVDRLSVYDG